MKSHLNNSARDLAHSIAKKRRRLACERLENRSMLHGTPLDSDLFFAIALGEEPVHLTCDSTSDQDQNLGKDVRKEGRHLNEIQQEPEGEPGSAVDPFGRRDVEGRGEPIGRASGQQLQLGRTPKVELPFDANSREGGPIQPGIGADNNSFRSERINSFNSNSASGNSANGLTNSPPEFSLGINAVALLTTTIPTSPMAANSTPTNSIRLSRVSMPLATSAFDASVFSQTPESSKLISDASRSQSHATISSQAFDNSENVHTVRSKDTSESIGQAEFVASLDAVPNSPRANRVRMTANSRNFKNGLNNVDAIQATPLRSDLKRAAELPNGDDGLLELATDRKRNFPESEWTGCLADELQASREREQCFDSIGLYREFDLAGTDTVFESRPIITDDGSWQTVEAVDAWFQDFGIDASLDATANTDFRQLALPTSFLAIGSLMVSSRRRFFRHRKTDDSGVFSEVM